MCQITRCQTDGVRNTQNTHKPTYNYADYSVGMFSAQLNKRKHLFLNLICLDLVGGGGGGVKRQHPLPTPPTSIQHTHVTRKGRVD